MTTEETGQKHEQKEKNSSMDCCSPHKFAEMMAKCGESMKCDCSSMMKEMRKGGFFEQEQK